MMNKIDSLLGFAQKSGNLLSGEHTCEMKLPTQKISLLILASDVSENTREKFTRLCEKHEVKCITLGAKAEISSAIGKYNRGVFGITTKKFSRAILDQVNQDL